MLWASLVMQCLLVGIWEFSYSNTFATYVYQFIVGFKIAQVSTAAVSISDADMRTKTHEFARVVQIKGIIQALNRSETATYPRHH